MQESSGQPHIDQYKFNSIWHTMGSKRTQLSKKVNNFFCVTGYNTIFFSVRSCKKKYKNRFIIIEHQNENYTSFCVVFLLLSVL